MSSLQYTLLVIGLTCFFIVVGLILDWISKQGEVMATEELVKNIIIEQLGVKAEEVTNEASFIDNLGADSLDLVELAMAVEDSFNIELPDEDIENLLTVGKFIEYVKGKVDEA